MMELVMFPGQIFQAYGNVHILSSFSHLLIFMCYMLFVLYGKILKLLLKKEENMDKHYLFPDGNITLNSSGI